MADQARLIAEPDLRIDLCCPACRYEWHAAQVLAGAWWGRGVTPQSIANLCHCPRCHAGPPMQAAPPPPLTRHAD